MSTLSDGVYWFGDGDRRTHRVHVFEVNGGETTALVGSMSNECFADITLRHLSAPDLFGLADYLRDAAETMVREREDKEATCRDCKRVGEHVETSDGCAIVHDCVLSNAETRHTVASCGLDHAALRGKS